MCGLFGVAGPAIQHLDLRALRELAYVSGVRGLDGTGVVQATVSKDKVTNYRLSKMGSEVSYFTWYNDNDKKGCKDIMNDVRCNFFIGHVRYATKGEINNQNAHPFEAKNLVGAHNGTLWDSKYIHKTKTDSEMMFLDMDNRGIYTTLSELIGTSAYAVTVYNNQDKKLYFARNDKRPLVFAFDVNRDVMFWASEAMPLKWVTSRNGIELGKICKFEEDCLYSFHPWEVRGGGKMIWQKNKIVRPVTPPFPKNDPPWENDNLKKFRNTTVFKASEVKRTESTKTQSSNVVNMKKEIEKRAEKRKTEYLFKYCVGCKVMMDLFDQYEGLELEPGVYRCKDCEDVIQTLKTFNSGTKH